MDEVKQRLIDKGKFVSGLRLGFTALEGKEGKRVGSYRVGEAAVGGDGVRSAIIDASVISKFIRKRKLLLVD